MITLTTMKRFAIPLLIALLVAGTAGCTREAKKKWHLSRADKFFAAEAYDSAEIEYIRALQNVPGDPKAISRLGAVYFAEGRLPQAFRLLQKAVELEPENLDLRLKLAQTLQFGGDIEGARQETITILNRQPANGEALVLLAETSTASTNVLATRQLLQSLPAQTQNSASGHLARGILFDYESKPTEAETEVRKAIELNPKSDRAHFILAKLCLGRKDLAGFEAAFKAAADLAPLRSDVRLRYAWFKLVIAGTDEAKRNEAKQLVAQITSKAPDYVPAWLWLARAAFQERNYTECNSFLQKLLTRDPLNYKGLVLKGDLLLHSGDGTNAAVVFERVVKAFPDDNVDPEKVAAQFALARAYNLNRQEVKAEATLEQIVASDTNNVLAALMLGEFQIRRGAYGPVVSSMTQILKRRPGPADTSSLLAGDYSEQPNFTEAAMVDACSLLAGAYTGQRNFAEAAAVYATMLRRFTNSFEATLRAGNGLAGLGRTNEAAAAYARVIECFPTNATAIAIAGFRLAAIHQNQAARQAHEAALKVSPGFLPAIEGLVNVDLTEKRIADARARANGAVERDPKSPGPWVLLARVEIEDAVAKAKRAKPDAEDDPSRLPSLASVPDAQNNVKTAENALLKVIELSPELPLPYYLLAQLYVACDQHQQALDRLQVQIAKTNDVGALLLTASIQSERGDYPAARDAYEAVLKARPDAVLALNNLACLYADRLNQPDRAYALAERAARLWPNAFAMIDTLGWTYYRKGEYASALALLDRANTLLDKQMETQPRDRAEAKYHRGMAYYMLGRKAPAEADLKDALAAMKSDFPGKAEAVQRLALLSLDPKSADSQSLATIQNRLREVADDPIALSLLGSIQERDQQFDKASRTYETALKYHPENTEFMFQQARLSADQLKQPDKALELAKTAHTLNPEDTRISQLMARLLLAKGDPKWAASLLEECDRKTPDDVSITYYLAWSYYTLGRVTEATSKMQVAAGKDFAKTADAQQFLELVTASQDVTKIQHFAAKFTNILAADPDYLPALVGSAALLESNSDWAKASQVYERILARYPTFTPATRNLALLTFNHLGNDRAAYDLAVKAREAFPNDAQVSRMLGILSYTRGDYSRAAQLLRESSSQVKNDGPLLFHLGMAQNQLKLRSEAKATLEQALALQLPAELADEAKRVLTELK